MTSIRVALTRDLPLAEVEETGKTSAHLSPRRERSNSYRGRPGPIYLQGDAIAARDLASDFETLRAKHMLSSDRSFEDFGKTARRASGHQPIGKLLLDDIGCEKPGKRVTYRPTLKGR